MSEIDIKDLKFGDGDGGVEFYGFHPGVHKILNVASKGVANTPETQTDEPTRFEVGREVGYACCNETTIVKHKPINPV